MSIEQFYQMALSFPGVIEHPHFDRTAFKVRDKRIFATLLPCLYYKTAFSFDKLHE